MWVDILCLLFYAWGTYKGLKNGLLASVLMLLGYLLAMVLAVKMGSPFAKIISDQLETTSVWIPALSFLLIFIGVILLVRFVIALLNKGVEAVMLGWVNKLGGVLFYWGLYTLLLLILFYWLSYVSYFKEGFLNQSVCFQILHDKFSLLIRACSVVWPSLQTAFSDMEHLLH